MSDTELVCSRIGELIGSFLASVMSVIAPVDRG